MGRTRTEELSLMWRSMVDGRARQWGDANRAQQAAKEREGYGGLWCIDRARGRGRWRGDEEAGDAVTFFGRNLEEAYQSAG